MASSNHVEGRKRDELILLEQGERERERERSPLGWDEGPTPE